MISIFYFWLFSSYNKWGGGIWIPVLLIKEYIQRHWATRLLAWKHAYREPIKTYTRTPVTVEAINVPRIANVTMAPKFEKNGFCKRHNDSVHHICSTLVATNPNWKAKHACAHTHTSKLKAPSTYGRETESRLSKNASVKENLM